MTKKEFMEKYKDVAFTFSRYFKYSFQYVGETVDGDTVLVSCGGDRDEIYRMEVVPGVEESIYCLDPNWGEVYKNESLVESFEDQK